MPPQTMTSFLMRCFQKDIEVRASAHELLKHSMMATGTEPESTVRRPQVRSLHCGRLLNIVHTHAARRRHPN